VDGRDVIKSEPPQGDATRGQLRDVPTPIRSTHDAELQQALDHRQHEEPGGKQVFVDLLKKCDIVMENFGPGVLDRLGFTWEKIHGSNPRS